ncbi:mechanosensitive ion channel domain-containing protein [Chromatocurvus halotolerans]|uniref:Small-conductance mechanosensitive channel n=1 Tax=Chromatocurvus halotolerans TaxID=1132028 RepID=A0A4R2KNF2_9GAMM|nr:mechanosensitive ion channel domain-containing protein [Chromatocurvus halotolerans]TCO75691.1 small-conductance mechanosensitive channel [Chromatocurvus halotolerans]
MAILSRSSAEVHRVTARWLLVLVCFLLADRGMAQTDASDAVTASRLDALSQQLQQSTELSEEERTRLAAELESAASTLAATRELQSTIDEVSDRIQRSEEEIARFETLIEESAQEPAPQPASDDVPLAELEAEIQLLVADRRSATARRTAIATELAAARQQGTAERDRLVAIQSQLEALPSTNLSEGASLKDRTADAMTQVRRAQLTAEAELLALRVRGQPALENILVAERNWLDVRINRLDRRLAALSEVARDLRRSAAQRQIEATQEIVSEMGETRTDLQALAEENMSLARQQEALGLELNAARRQILELRETLDNIERDASLSRRRLAVSGLQPELADVMLSRLRTLPGQRGIASAIDRRNTRINEVAIAAIDNDEDVREMSDRESFLKKRFPDHADWDSATRDSLNKLLDQHMRLLRENAQAQSQLQQVLIDTNELAAGLYDSIESYEEFLTSNLLWTRNHSYVDPMRLKDQVKLLISTDGLLQLRDRLPQAVLSVEPLLLGLLVALLLVFRRRIKRELEEQLGKPIRPRDERSDRIFTGIALSVAYASAVPLAVFAISLVIRNAAADNAQLSGIAAGLMLASLVLFSLSFLRHITGRLGVGRRRLKWNGQKMDCLRPALSWLTPVLVTGAFTAGFGLSTSATDSGGPLTAIATLAIAVALLLAGLRALRSELFTADRIVLYGFRAAVVLSAAIAIMHVTGHLFAAHLYLDSLGLSIAAFLLILFVTNILYRVGLIFNAKIERRTRDESRALQEGGESAVDNADDLATVASLSGANTQLLSLMRVLGLAIALWLIWSPALPALNIFNEIGLWNVADSTLPDGQLRVVSLATLINAIFILVITALVTKHLPPLIDVLLMEWTGITPGSRYAIRVLMQYVIIGTGLTMSLSLLGWEWGKVQWLVAALGVGIGFGLQEIVANFISGLILLFERPIRVGDIITAGGGDGTVTQINARATVIESFEGKELMIPNKELITGVVTNWSLSTSNLRVVIAVGVAYGSDVREAMRILIEVAHDNPSVIEEPEPTATFEDFGDNSLLIWLRCYAEREYPRVWTELRTEINERFNEAGISIAFPQRDIHLDAASPIPVQVVEPAKPVAPPETPAPDPG